MPMFHAYCQNSAEHAKLANQVSISMNKTLKPSLRGKFTATFYGSGHYYYFINAIRVMSFAELDNDGLDYMTYENLYSGEYRRDYVYDDEEYNKDIFVNSSFWLGAMLAIGQEVDIYKKSIFSNAYSDASRYKYDGIYTSSFGEAVINGENETVLTVKAGLKTGDIVNIDNRECFLIKYFSSWACSFMAIAID